jgi:hypothetical protein
MNTPPRKPPSPHPAADDPLIPVLTERLGLPPLDFDTTLPVDTALPVDTVLPGEYASGTGAAIAPTADPPAGPAADAAATAAAAPGAAQETTQGTAPGVTQDATHGATQNRAAQIDRLEIELRAAILQSIAEKLPQDLESIVRNRMGPAIDRLVNSAAADLRMALAASLQEIIGRAVRGEIERLHSSNRGPS